MVYLITEILLCLALAALLGGALGWLAHRARSTGRLNEARRALQSQGRQLAQARTEVQMITDDFEDLRERARVEIDALREDNARLPILAENLENSQLLVRQMIQRHDAQVRELSAANVSLERRLAALREHGGARQERPPVAEARPAAGADRAREEMPTTDATGATDESMDEVIEIDADLAAELGDGRGAGQGAADTGATDTDATAGDGASAERRGDPTPGEIVESPTDTSIVATDAEPEAGIGDAPQSVASAQGAHDTLDRLDTARDEIDVGEPRIDSAANGLDRLTSTGTEDGDHDGSHDGAHDEEDPNATLAIDVFSIDDLSDARPTGGDDIEDSSGSGRTEDAPESASVLAAGDLPPFEPVDRQDDLQRIFGIGPITEKALNELGITSYPQLARLERPEIETIARALQIVPERIESDDWVGNARRQLEDVLEEL
mgnify:CR=1 FL=1